MGQKQGLGHHNPLYMLPGFSWFKSSFSISQSIFLQLMARVKWMNQGDINDQII
jgi:hypothetical protein